VSLRCAGCTCDSSGGSPGAQTYRISFKPGHCINTVFELNAAFTLSLLLFTRNNSDPKPTFNDNVIMIMLMFQNGFISRWAAAAVVSMLFFN
jgi:hypothetical protein